MHLHNELITKDKQVLLTFDPSQEIKTKKMKDGNIGALFPGFTYYYTLQNVGYSAEEMKGAQLLKTEELEEVFRTAFENASKFAIESGKNNTSHGKDDVSPGDTTKVRPKKSFEVVKGNCGNVVVPKGYFASVLPAQVVKYLADAKRMRKKELTARIEKLNLASSKLHSLTEDKYAGDFGLWLNTLYIFARSPDNTIRSHVWELTSQTLALMAKGRTHVLPSVRKAYSQILSNTSNLRPIGLPADGSVLQTYRDVLVSKASPVKENVLKTVNTTKAKVTTGGKQSLETGKHWWQRVSRVFSTTKRRVSEKLSQFWSEVNPTNTSEGKEAEADPPAIAEPFIVAKRVMSKILFTPISNALKGIINWFKT